MAVQRDVSRSGAEVRLLLFWAVPSGSQRLSNMENGQQCSGDSYFPPGKIQSPVIRGALPQTCPLSAERSLLHAEVIHELVK